MTVKSETTSQQGVGFLRECLNVCVCAWEERKLKGE